MRRWFERNHGITFHAYSRSRRLGEALGRIRQGEDVSRTAYEQGYESLSGFQEAFRKLLGAPPTQVKHALPVHVNRVPQQSCTLHVECRMLRVYVILSSCRDYSEGGNPTYQEKNSDPLDGAQESAATGSS